MLDVQQYTGQFEGFAVCDRPVGEDQKIPLLTPDQSDLVNKDQIKM